MNWRLESARPTTGGAALFAGLSDLLKQLPAFALSIGICFLIVGGIVHASVLYGWVAPTAGGIEVSQLTPLMLATGLGLTLAGAAFQIPGVISSARQSLRKRKRRKEADEQARGNVNFLDAEAQALLLAFLSESSGRLPPMPGIPPIIQIYKYRIIQSEDGSISMAGRLPAGVLKVRPSIFKDREAIAARLAVRLSAQYECDVTQRENIERICRQIFQFYGVTF